MTGRCGWHDCCPSKYICRAKVGTPGSVWESTELAHSDLEGVLRKECSANSPISRKTHAAVVERLEDQTRSARSIDVQRDLLSVLDHSASIEFISRQKRQLAPAAISDLSKDREFIAACESRIVDLENPATWPEDRSSVSVFFCEFREAHVTVVWGVLRFVEC